MHSPFGSPETSQYVVGDMQIAGLVAQPSGGPPPPQPSATMAAFIAVHSLGILGTVSHVNAVFALFSAAQIRSFNAMVIIRLNRSALTSTGDDRTWIVVFSSSATRFNSASDFMKLARSRRESSPRNRAAAASREVLMRARRAVLSSIMPFTTRGW